MNIQIPVTVLCEGCAQCPRLTIAAEKEYAMGNLVSQEFECANMNECMDVMEAMERARKAREEGKA